MCSIAKFLLQVMIDYSFLVPSHGFPRYLQSISPSRLSNWVQVQNSVWMPMDANVSHTLLSLSPLTTSVGVLEDPPSPSSQFAVSKWHDASVVADGGCINHDQDTKPMAAQARASGTLIGLRSFDVHLAVPGIQSNSANLTERPRSNAWVLTVLRCRVSQAFLQELDSSSQGNLGGLLFLQETAETHGMIRQKLTH